MNDFFRVGEEFTNHEGFKMYGLIHISWLIGMFVVGMLITKYFCGLDQYRRDKFKKKFAIFFFVLELSRHLLIAYRGYYTLDNLPMHLCSFMIFISIIQAFVKSQTLNESLFLLSIPGALAALLFPDWVSKPPFIYTTVHSFLTHGLLILYVSMQLKSKDIVPDITNVPWVFIPLAFASILMFFVNKAWNTNFFFMNVPSPGSPLVFLEKIFGNPGYVFGLAVLVIIVWCIEYFIYGIIRKRDEKRSPKIPKYF